jgi:hypothetical protein
MINSRESFFALCNLQLDFIGGICKRFYTKDLAIFREIYFKNRPEFKNNFLRHQTHLVIRQPLFFNQKPTTAGLRIVKYCLLVKRFVVGLENFL